MNLGQMMLVIGALALLGLLTLTSNRTILQSNQTQSESEFGITSISLATSVIEEAMGTLYDASVGNPTGNAVDSLPQLTPPASLGHGGTESYHAVVGGTTDFNDFDDFNGLFLVYKSPRDSTSTPGSDYEYTVPNLRNKYFVRVKVNYVDLSNLGSTSSSNPRSWHKRISVVVQTPFPRIGSAQQIAIDSIANTMVFPAIMSYWN